MPNETQNDTPTPEYFQPEVTVEDKRKEIYLALKFLAVRSVQLDAIDSARHCLRAAEIVSEVELPNQDHRWEGI